MAVIKCQHLVIAALIFLVKINYSMGDHRMCSLEDMRILAVHACEHLFRDMDTRGKRDTDNNEISSHVSTKNDTILYDQIPERDNKVRVHRRTFPKGGYLVLTETHASMLREKNYSPSYRTIPLDLYKKEKHRRRMRSKREDPGYIDMPYCCLNKCRLDLLCKSK